MKIEVKNIVPAVPYINFFEFITFIAKGEFLKPFGKWAIPLIIISFVTTLLWFILGLIALSIILWPLFKAAPQALYFKYFQKNKIQNEAEEAFKKFIGKPVKFIDIGIGFSKDPKTIIGAYGLAYDAGVVYVMEHGVAAKLPWSEIRSWSWNIDGYSKTVVYGGSLANNQAANMQAAIHNNIAKWDAFRNSGFFIKVSDINHPQWQFMSTEEKTLIRWMEIFNQINEGKLD